MADEPTRDQFREAASRFATGLVVVACVVDGHPHAMTASSFVPVSLDPLLAMVSVQRGTRFHEAALSVTEWAVSVLAADAVDAARWFATKGRPLADQFADVAHSPGVVTGAPVITGSLAALECRTVDVHRAGDHDLLVGQVLSVAVTEASPPPLLYHRRGYRLLGPSAP